METSAKQLALQSLHSTVFSLQFERNALPCLIHQPRLSFRRPLGCSDSRYAIPRLWLIVAVLIVLAFIVVSATGFKYDRIDKNNAVLLVVDHQVGLYQISRDMDALAFKSNILAHASLGKIFNLPTILTTSAETGTDVFRSFLAHWVFADFFKSRTQWTSPEGDP